MLTLSCKLTKTRLKDCFFRRVRETNESESSLQPGWVNRELYLQVDPKASNYDYFYLYLELRADFWGSEIPIWLLKIEISKQSSL